MNNVALLYRSNGSFPCIILEKINKDLLKDFDDEVYFKVLVGDEITVAFESHNGTFIETSGLWWFKNNGIIK